MHVRQDTLLLTMRLLYVFLVPKDFTNLILVKVSVLPVQLEHTVQHQEHPLVCHVAKESTIIERVRVHAFYAILVQATRLVQLRPPYVSCVLQDSTLQVTLAWNVRGGRTLSEQDPTIAHYALLASIRMWREHPHFHIAFLVLEVPIATRRVPLL